MKSLVIVESGAKAKKIKGYLDANFPDKDWLVEACVGHVRDLSDKENAVDPDDWSNLNWEFSTKGKKVMRELRKLCKDTDLLYLATDPDREGEAIAWHLLSDFEAKKLVKDVDVKIGQKVKQGEKIGTVGKTGRSTGPHLDIRLNWFNVKLDPASVLKLN